MIQRIQTILLFLTTLLAALFLSGSILTFSDGSFMSLKGISESASTGINVDFPLLTVILLLVPFVSFVTIFLYKNRRLQMKMTVALIVLILLEIAVVAYYAYTLIVAHNTELGPGAKMVLPPVMLVLAILAYRGIKKDENLVKSYDRLR
jgi:glucan phosphoethanolaminetransferase (alkaline phosphatase superfamily)